LADAISDDSEKRWRRVRHWGKGSAQGKPQVRTRRQIFDSSAMTYPVNLVDISGIAIAAACVRLIAPEARGEVRKMWRLAVPPLLAVAVAIIILAGAVSSFEHDAVWVATGMVGCVAGLLRGRSMAVTTDQVWGLVRLPPSLDGIATTVGVFLCATIDGLSGLFPTGTLPRHAHFAAAAALFAGYLGGRAWRIATRAIRSQHADLQHR